MLSESELERLMILSEECAEVQQIISKIIRYGIDSFHPDDINKITNRSLLEDEIGDVLLIINMLYNRNDINKTNVENRIKIKKNKIKKYLHHNIITEND